MSRLAPAFAFAAFAGPIFAGCASDGGGERTAALREADGVRYGCDYSFARPSPASLVAQGFTFAARYLSHSSAKNLSKGEADALIAAGIDIVSNFEDSATNALNGYNQGVSDAQLADGQAAACGAPATRPIYFSVDFDASEGQQAAINSYFDGVASVLGVGRTGAYGGYYVIKRLFDAGKITWGWQAYAWSGGQWDPRAQARQIQNGIDNDTLDKDEAVAADFGQWGVFQANQAPRGAFDVADCDHVAGWAQDPDAPDAPIQVHAYYNGSAGQPGAVGIAGIAGNSRPDLCTAIGSCNHGFDYPTPRALLDGQAHPIFTYGIDSAGGANTLLTNSPMTITCPTPAVAAGQVKRHIVSPDVLTAWQFNTFVDDVTYPAGGLASVPDGVDFAAGPQVVQAMGDAAVYVVDGAYKRHVVNPPSLDAWRIGLSVKPIAAADLAALVAGPDWPEIPALVNAASDPAIYVLDVPFPSQGAEGAGGSSQAGAGGGDAGGGDAGGSNAGGGDAGGNAADAGGAGGDQSTPIGTVDGANSQGGGASKGDPSRATDTSTGSDESSGACDFGRGTGATDSTWVGAILGAAALVAKRRARHARGAR